MSTAPQLPSFEELYATVAALPAGQTGEILGPGWVRAMSRPGARHASASRRLLGSLGSVHLDDGGDWFIEAELEIRLFDRLYVPDLVGWRLESGADLGFLDANPITRTPEWACEVLSRSTQRADRVIKLPIYAAAGVAHVWIFDVEARSIEVYAPRDGHPALVASARAGAPIALPPFAAVIDPEALLRRPERR